MLKGRRLGTVALAGAALVVASAAGAGTASATTVTWDLSNGGSSNVDLGTTHTFVSTPAGYSLVASGFTDKTTWTPTDIYAKNTGGDEIGLGINNDPTNHDHEIWGKTFIQIDVSAAVAAGVHGFSFQMGSTTNGEAWDVYGANSTGVGAILSSLYTKGTNETPTVNPLVGGYKYYDFFYSTTATQVSPPGNVLLFHDFAAVGGAPEPSTWAMMGLGFAGLAFAGYRRAKGAVALA